MSVASLVCGELCRFGGQKNNSMVVLGFTNQLRGWLEDARNSFISFKSLSGLLHSKHAR